MNTATQTADALIGVVQANVTDKAGFLADLLDAATNGVDATQKDFGDYGGTFATVKAALPESEMIGAHHWEITIGGIVKQIAYFCDEAPTALAPLAGNTGATNYKAQILAAIAARIDDL